MKNFTKFRALKNKGYSYNSNKLIFYHFGLIALSSGFLKKKQLESSRKVITHIMNRECKLIFRIFPTVSVTKKPQEMRMGNGKGDIIYYICSVKPNRVICELGSRNIKLCIKALKAASYKLPVKTKIICNL